MFGYIKPMTGELKVREHELYRSIYCGLCSAMGENICHSQRFTLSYDIVFLALVRTAATDETIHVEKRRCMVHPLKKRNRAFIPNALKYSSQAAAILTYYNIADDIDDSKGAKRLRSSMMLPWAKRFLRKADLPEITDRCRKHLADLRRLEEARSSLDACADCFGRMLGYIFSYGIEDGEKAAALDRMGYHTGVWIYIIDAADDFEKDKKSGEFNPLSAYPTLPREPLITAATLHLADAKAAFDTLKAENKAIKAIIDNILTLGMPEIQDKIFKEKEQDEGSL